MTGIVYVLQQSNLPTSVIKVGRTYKLEKRIYEHQRINKTEIAVLASYSVNNIRETEVKAHHVVLKYGKSYQYVSHKEYFVVEDIGSLISELNREFN